MSQPVWQYVTNLADASPLEYGGRFLFKDKTGVYSPELEALEPPSKEHESSLGGYNDSARWRVYRYTIHQLVLVNKQGQLLVNKQKPVSSKNKTNIVGLYRKEIAEGESELPLTIHLHKEWFSDDLPAVCQSQDTTLDDLYEAFSSDDIEERAWAYGCVEKHFGLDEIAADPPLILTELQVYERYLSADNVKFVDEKGMPADLIDEPPAHILPVLLENTENSPLELLASVKHPLARRWADNDRTICGTRWECDGSNFAYAKISWSPRIVEHLRGYYTVDDSAYTPPDEHEINVGNHMAECDECRLHGNFEQSKKHYEEPARAIVSALRKEWPVFNTVNEDNLVAVVSRVIQDKNHVI